MIVPVLPKLREPQHDRWRTTLLTTDADRRAVVDRIRQENEEQFGKGARVAVQKMLSADVPHPWMYVYELTQNAIDAGAKRVCWRAEGDTVVFQHDGRTALDESHVRGLSSLGASTKGLGMVGFMGVGFKSVFARFREACVSDFDWRFRFHVRVHRGDLGSQVPEWFDTLRPHWDDEVPDPEKGYTTAFLLRRPADPKRSVDADLARLASSENGTPLAVIARRGLTEMRVENIVWDLSVDDSIVTVHRSGSDASWRWRAFVSRYRPDDDAMRRLLEVRQETHDQIDKRGRRVEREVVGLLPLDDNGLPRRPNHGRVYATLPTQVQIPFGFHLQADWFVNVDRQNLREVEGDAWQEAIVGQVPEIVRQLLIWLSGESDSVRERGYAALCKPDDNDGLLTKPLQDLRDNLVRTLAEQPIVPVHGPGARRFCTPEETALLPEPFDADFGSGWRPDLLFGPNVMDEHLLGTDARDFALWLEWGALIEADEVAWKDTLPDWWRALPEDERQDALFALWRGVAENEWNDVPVVPTKAGKWTPAHATDWVDEALPTAREPGGRDVAEALEEYLPSRERQIQARVRSWVNNAPQEDGVQWLKAQHNHERLSDLIRQAADEDAELPLVELLAWALHRGDNRQDLVPLVLSEEGPCEPEDALVADPLVQGGRNRRLLFRQPALVADYAAIDDRRSVVAFLQRLGVGGEGALEERTEGVGRWNRGRVATLLGIDESEVEDANNRGYSVKDYRFPFEVDSVPPEALQSWLTLEHDALREKSCRSADSSFSYPRFTQGQAPAQWVRDLQTHAWLLCTDGERRKPGEVLLEADPDREDAPVADIDAGLASRLEEEGVEFGGEVPLSPALRRLERRGATDMADGDLAALLREAIEAVEAGEATEDDLRRALDAVMLHGAPLARRVVQRTGTGAGQRGNLGGWVVAITDVERPLGDAVGAVEELLEIPDTTTGQHALDFLQDVWHRKPAQVESLRGHLAAAYRYVLDDVGAEDLSATAWNDARARARLYGRRAWHAIGSRLVVDDVQSPLVHQFLPTDRTAVASAHLGDTPTQIRRVAQALDVALLSDAVDVEPGTAGAEPSWGRRLRRLTATLSQLEDRLPLDEITVYDALALRVDDRSHAIQAYVNDATLMLVGDPTDFAVEAAEQLVEYFQLGQRGMEVPRLTGALSALDDESAFLRHLRLLADGLGVTLAALPFERGNETSTQGTSTEESADERPATHATPQGQETTPDDEPNSKAAPPTERPEPSEGDPQPLNAGGQPPEPRTRSGGPNPTGPDRVGAPPLQPPARLPAGRSTRSGSEQDHADPRRRGARAHQDAGERHRSRTPSGGRAADHVRMLVLSCGREASAGNETSSQAGSRNDHTARQAVLHYEKHRGRRAEEMDALQPGFDVRSIDAAGRERRIEVKGVQGMFEGDASVALTARQARDAVENEEDGVDYWLYVVDSTETDRPRVFPIRWARDRTRLRYGFHAYAWADAAERPAEATAEGLKDLSLDALDPLDPGDLV